MSSTATSGRSRRAVGSIRSPRSSSATTHMSDSSPMSATSAPRIKCMSSATRTRIRFPPSARRVKRSRSSWVCTRPPTARSRSAMPISPPHFLGGERGWSLIASSHTSAPSRPASRVQCPASLWRRTVPGSPRDELCLRFCLRTGFPPPFSFVAVMAGQGQPGSARPPADSTRSTRPPSPCSGRPT